MAVALARPSSPVKLHLCEGYLKQSLHNSYPSHLATSPHEIPLLYLTNSTSFSMSVFGSRSGASPLVSRPQTWTSSLAGQPQNLDTTTNRFCSKPGPTTRSALDLDTITSSSTLQQSCLLLLLLLLDLRDYMGSF